MFNRERARELKARGGHTTKWLAGKCKVSPQYIRLILTGGRHPSEAVAALMAQAYQVPERELWTDREPTAA